VWLATTAFAGLAASLTLNVSSIAHTAVIMLK
jgi:hypothetical protein